jgi:hypothetical protein
MKRIVVFSALTLLFLVPNLSLADDDPDQSPCPTGQVPVTFADGNNVTTVCMEAGAQMDETVVEENESLDPSNYD